MAFTYDTTTDVGKVRFLCGDTAEPTHRLEDDEVEAALSLNGGYVIPAAAMCCDSLAAKLAADPEDGHDIGDYKVDLSRKISALQAMGARLRQVDEDQPAFAIAEENLTTMNELTILRNYCMRTEAL